MLVAGNDQLDQWLAAHPEELLTRAPEPAVVNPANPFVLDPHLRCAAHELPLTHADERWWPGLLDDGVRRLVQADELAVRHRGRRQEPIAVWVGTGWPSATASASATRPARRCGSSPRDGERPVGDVDRARAPEQVHAGRVLPPPGPALAGGRRSTSTSAWRASSPTTAPPTRSRGATPQVRLLDVDADATGRARAGLQLGTVEVHTTVVGYQRKDALTGARRRRRTPLDLPRSTLVTRAIWYVVDAGTVVARRASTARGSRVRCTPSSTPPSGCCPLFAICDRWDVGGVSTACQADTGLPTIVIYDAMPGGAGVAELGYEAADRHLPATRESIAACPCADGCPSCVQSPKCGNGNEHLDKARRPRPARARSSMRRRSSARPVGHRRGVGPPPASWSCCGSCGRRASAPTSGTSVAAR